MIASIALPVGLFWFAWTNSPDIHWLASVAAGVPFGFGMVLVFLSVFNYLIDAYTIFAASVLAANSLLRSLFGFAFPLFTTYMYQNLGIHWASCVPAFLALACVPFPFILYKKGLAIRKYCKFSAQSEAFVQSLLQGAMQKDTTPEEDEPSQADQSTIAEAATRVPSAEDHGPATPHALEKESADEVMSIRSLSRVGTHTSQIHRVPTYDGNPYNIDRIHTRESFK
jgi:hypothetical protein